MTRTLPAVAVALSSVVAVVYAQPPLRDPPVPTAARTIRGRVVAGDTGDPLRNVRVGLTADSTVRPVLSDGEGRFALESVPAGSHEISATKAGYAAGHAIDGGEIRLVKGGVISGRVADEAGEGLPLVTVAADRRVRGGGPFAVVRAATVETDDHGEYRLFGLAAADYLVSIAGVRGVGGPGRLEFGGRALMVSFYPGVARPDLARPIPVEPGDEVAGINLTFRTIAAPPRNASGMIIPRSFEPPRAVRTRPASLGSIRGRVVRPDGLPLVRAHVQIASSERLFTPDEATTDEEGRYEFREVRPGAYLVTANMPGYRSITVGQRSASERGDLVTVDAGETVDRLDITLPRGDAISGRIFDEYGEPVENAAVAVWRVRVVGGRRQLVGVPGVASTRTDDLGRYRIFGLPPGRYLVGGVVGQIVPGIPATDLRGYARTFFPDAVTPAGAHAVEVREGEDRMNVDISLIKSGVARIAGRVLGADGKPAACTVSLSPSHRSGAVATPVRSMKADDSFEFSDVPPGEYIVQASKSRVTRSTEGEFGAQFVTVDGDSATIVLRMTAGSTVSGRVLFEGDPPAAVDDFELSPISSDVDLSSLAGNLPARAEVHDDWTFELAGLNGLRRLRVMQAPAGWTLKQILINGFDATDSPLPFGTGEQSLAGVEVVMSNKVTEIAGAIADLRGRPVTDAAVVALASDRARWYAASRFLGHADAVRDGTFTIRGLAPGDYLVAVVDKRTVADVSAEIENPEFLESLVAGAERVTIGEGQRAWLSLKLDTPK